MATTVKVGDYGTPFDFTVTSDGEAQDISDATSRTIVFVAPDDNLTRTEHEAEFLTDGSDGIIQMILPFGLINVSGTWQVQAFIVTPDGGWHSDIYKLKVGRSL